MKNLLIVVDLGEAATGAALIIAPSFVARLLLGEGLSGVSVVVGRVGGIALLSLGLACWPRSDSARSASSGILLYSLLVTLYLLYLGIRGQWVGLLLWPAVVLHAVLTALLARGRLVERMAGKNNNMCRE